DRLAAGNRQRGGHRNLLDLAGAGVVPADLVSGDLLDPADAVAGEVDLARSGARCGELRRLGDRGRGAGRVARRADVRDEERGRGGDARAGDSGQLRGAGHGKAPIRWVVEVGGTGSAFGVQGFE